MEGVPCPWRSALALAGLRSGGAASTGPASAGLGPEGTPSVLGAQRLADGRGRRGTGRLWAVEKATGHEWLRRLGTPGAARLASPWRPRHRTAWQLAE